MAEGTFDDITERLDQIIAQVRSKDTSLAYTRSNRVFGWALRRGFERRGRVRRAHRGT